MTCSAWVGHGNGKRCQSSGMIVAQEASQSHQDDAEQDRLRGSVEIVPGQAMVCAKYNQKGHACTRQ